MVSLVNFISSKRVLDFRNRSVGVVLLHGEIALHIVKSMLHIYAVRTPCSGVNLDNGRKITQVHGAHRRGVRFGGLATKDGPASRVSAAPALAAVVQNNVVIKTTKSLLPSPMHLPSLPFLSRYAQDAASQGSRSRSLP